jgi:hypothetical protein
VLSGKVKKFDIVAILGWWKLESVAASLINEFKPL